MRVTSTQRNMNMQRRFVVLLLVALAAPITAGCRQEPTTVAGLVTLDGAPLKVGEGMRGSVVFQPVVADGVTLNGIIDAQGRYELAEGASSTVTPSTYWVTVSAVQILPASDERPQASGRRITPAKYASATDSGFRFEVVPGVNEINLPLVSEPSAGAEPAATADDKSASDDAGEAANATGQVEVSTSNAQ